MGDFSGASRKEIISKVPSGFPDILESNVNTPKVKAKCCNHCEETAYLDKHGYCLVCPKCPAKRIRSMWSTGFDTNRRVCGETLRRGNSKKGYAYFCPLCKEEGL